MDISQSRHIFISYSRKDRDFATALADKLLMSGYRVWIDRSLKVGEDWEKMIEKRIRDASEMIVILSRNSLKSEWVKHEGSMAYALGKRIFPILIEDVKDHELPIWAKKIQYHNFVDTDFEKSFQSLIQDLTKPSIIQDLLDQHLKIYLETGELIGSNVLSLILEDRSSLIEEDKSSELIEKSKRTVYMNKRIKQAAIGLLVILLLVSIGLLIRSQNFAASSIRYSNSLSTEVSVRTTAEHQENESRILAEKGAMLSDANLLNANALLVQNQNPSLGLLLSARALELMLTQYKETIPLATEYLYQNINYSNHKFSIIAQKNTIIRAEYNNNANLIVVTSLCYEDSEKTCSSIWTSNGKLISYLDEHNSPVVDAAFNVEGNKLLTIDLDGNLLFWDQNGRKLFHKNIEAGIFRIEVDKNDNVFVHSADGYIRIFDFSGQELNSFYTGPNEGTIYGFYPQNFGISENGKYIATSLVGYGSFLLNSHGNVVFHSANTNPIIISYNGDKFLNYEDTNLILHKTTESEESEIIFSIHFDTPLLAYTINNDGTEIVAIDANGILYIFNSIGEEINSFSIGSTDNAKTFYCSDKNIVTIKSHGRLSLFQHKAWYNFDNNVTIQIWNQLGQELFTKEHITSFIDEHSLNKDCTTIVTGFENGIVDVTSLVGNKPFLKEVDSTNEIFRTSLGFGQFYNNKNFSYAILSRSSSGYSGELFLYNEFYQPLATYEVNYPNNYSSSRYDNFIEKFDLMVLPNKDGVNIYNKSNSLIGQICNKSDSKWALSISSIMFDKKNDRLYCSTADNLEIWKIEKSSNEIVLHQIDNKEYSFIDLAQLSNDGKFLLISKTTKFYDLKPPWIEVMDDNLNVISYMELAGDSYNINLSGNGAYIYVHDLRNGAIEIYKNDGTKSATVNKSPEKINKFFLINEKGILATMTENNAILDFWTLEGQFIKSVNIDNQEINYLDYSEEKDMFIGSTNGGMIYLWDEDRVISLQISSHEFVPKMAVFSDDSRRIMTLSDFELYVWDNIVDVKTLITQAKEKANRQFTPSECKNFPLYIECKNLDIEE